MNKAGLSASCIDVSATNDLRAQNLSATPSPEWGTESAPSESPSLVGRILPGNLRVLGQLDEIPEGPLYRAQYSTGLEVVLVILRRQRNDRRPTDDSIAQLRLQRQLRQASQIKHPNVAAVYEIDETPDGLLYVAMEHLSGELLSTILAVRGAISLGEALDLCRQAAAGLQAAHEVGVMHGNLSPSTILITESEGRARVKLIRFSPVSFSTEQADRQVDKPAADYASPERLQGYPPDQKGDVFSLGAVLHHLLSGTPPPGPGTGAVPKVLRAVLTRALDPSPAQRFQTMAEFAGELDRATAARSTGRIAHQFLRWGAAAAGLVCILLAVLWLPRSLRRQRLGTARPAAETVTRAPPAKTAGAPAIPQKIRRPAPFSRSQTAAKQSSDPSAPPAKADKPLTAGARSDASARQPQLSPFRRSHPWAAAPGQRFYFRSSCKLALRSPELRYFKSAAEARAGGYVPSPVPGCH
jgi:serine/threonine protein kinase